MYCLGLCKAPVCRGCLLENPRAYMYVLQGVGRPSRVASDCTYCLAWMLQVATGLQAGGKDEAYCCRVELPRPRTGRSRRPVNATHTQPELERILVIVRTLWSGDNI